MLIYHVTHEWPTIASMSCLFLCMTSHHFDVLIKINYLHLKTYMITTYVLLKPIQSCTLYHIFVLFLCNS